MTAYYNEIDAYAAQWLRNLIAAGHIAPGDVDERPIQEVKADDVRNYRQCHFFAGIGGWSYALRLAGWDDSRSVWTGSCPCQPFSVAGKGKAQKDERHLWPYWFKLIAEVRPAIVFGEQVAGAIAHGWLDDAFDDLERQGYETGAAVLPACSVGAPHKRDRLWFVGIADCTGRDAREQASEAAGYRDSAFSASADAESMAHSKRQQLRAAGLREAFGSSSTVQGEKQERERVRNDVRQCSEALADSDQPRPQGRDGGILPECPGELTARTSSAFTSDTKSGERGEQKAGYRQQMFTRRGEEIVKSNFWESESGVCRVSNGIPARAHKLRAYGNAIVPQVAAEFIKASMECLP